MVVELPDEWRFLEELPAEWVAPAELRQGRRSSTMNLLLEILASDITGNDVLAAAGRMVSSYAAFNGELAASGPSAYDFEDVTNAAVQISYITRDIYGAWGAFKKAFGPTRRSAEGQEQRLLLLHALEDGASRLDQMRADVRPVGEE